MQIFDHDHRPICRLVLLMMTGLFLSTCGTSDVSENLLDYSVSMSLSDAGTESTRDIDLTMNPDCDGDVTTDDPEIFTNVSADITITNDGGEVIRVESYTVDYLPQPTEDGSGNLVTPPSLGSYPDAILNSDWVDTGTSSTISGLTVMTFDTKAEAAAGLVNLVGLYTISVTLNIVDEDGNHFTLVANEQAALSFYDNCD
jgi:hypothetical protein